MVAVFLVIFTAEVKDILLQAESESARYGWGGGREENWLPCHAFCLPPVPRNKWVELIMEATDKYARAKKQERQLQQERQRQRSEKTHVLALLK